jgi:hypothetical protein
MKLFSKRNSGAFLIALAGLLLISMIAGAVSTFGIDSIPSQDITFVVAFIWSLLIVISLMTITRMIIKGYELLTEPELILWDSTDNPCNEGDGCDITDPKECISLNCSVWIQYHKQ